MGAGVGTTNSTKFGVYALRLYRKHKCERLLKSIKETITQLDCPFKYLKHSSSLSRQKAASIKGTGKPNCTVPLYR